MLSARKKLDERCKEPCEVHQTLPRTSRAAENAAVYRGTVFFAIRLRKERTEAVAEKNKFLSRILTAEPERFFMKIFNHSVETVLVCKVAEFSRAILLRKRRRLSVPAVIFRYEGDSVVCKKRAEMHVPRSIFGHAVAQFNDAFYLTVRDPSIYDNVTPVAHLLRNRIVLHIVPP